MTPEQAQAFLGYLDEVGNQPEPPAPPASTGMLRTIADLGIKGAQGVVDLGQSVVGLGSLATGGLAGKAMRAIGYDPERTNQALAEYLSPAQREAEKKVNEAEGFGDTLMAAVQNPRAVAGSVVESLPSMFGIGGVTNAVARRIALRAAAPFGGVTTEAGAKAAQEAIDAATSKLTWASGAGEGAQSAGQIADQAQGAGREYSDYALPALASGVATAGITRGAGKLMGNTETALFSGSKTAGVQGGLPARVAKGFVGEGALQEMPQSAAEQVATNAAMGEPDLMKGVANQAAMGLVTGGVMGMGEGAVSPHQAHQPSPKEAADAVRATQTVPQTGVLSAAANVGTEAKAQTIENSPPAAPAVPEAPPIDPVMEQIKSLPAPAREEALHAYNIINRPDVAKGVRQYNSKLLDKHLATLEAPQAEAAQAAPEQSAAGAAADVSTAEPTPAAQTLPTTENAGELPATASSPPSVPALGAAAEAGIHPAQAVAPTQGAFATVEDAQAYIGQQRRAGGARIEALPVPHEDGSFGVAVKGSPEFDRAEAFKAQQALHAAGVMEGDILTKAGGIFKNKLAATRTLKAAGEGHAVVPVDGGFVVRKQTLGKSNHDDQASARATDRAAAPAQAAGGEEWSRFPSYTGTLGVPRADMPQIRSEHHGPLTQFLNARGVTHETVEVDPRSLKPTQAEYSISKAEQMAGMKEGDRSILVSSDNHVLDGHHQWLAAGGNGESVKAIRLNGPIKDLIPLAKEFPSAQTAQEQAKEAGRAAPVPEAAADSAKAQVQPEGGSATIDAGKTVEHDAALTPAAADGQKAMFSRAAPSQVDVSDERTGISTALLELGKQDGIFQYPRSQEKDMEKIGADKDLKVSDLDRETDDENLWMIANTTPHDSKGVKSWLVELAPGRYATVTDNHGEVYINVAAVGEGQGGSRVYDLAANYAANNGKVFIGDPNGVSQAAMRRRLENMLSSAVKYGTTDHLEPHADQVEGRPEIGVPALKWTKGDTLGNIRSMVDASIAATEATNPIATANVRFDPATQSFRDGENHGLDVKSLSEMLGFDGRARGMGTAGRRTVQRTALFNSLLSGADARRAFLASLRGQQDGGSAGAGGALKGTFYSRGEQLPLKFDGLSKPAAQLGIEALKSIGLNVKLVETQDDLPQSGLERINSEGITGVRGMYDQGTDTIWAVRQNLSGPQELFFVAMHEAFHRGLRKTFGADVQPLLNTIFTGNQNVRREVARYMSELQISRNEAIEEVLADMAGAGTARDLKGWDKLVAFLKGALLKLADKFGAKITVSDDMVEDLVVGLRRAGADGVHMDLAHGINTAMASRKDVVGESQGGRSADDVTPGAKSKRLSPEALRAGENFVSQIEALAEEHGKVYIRWSPDSWRDLMGDQVSRDFVSGSTHPGLSAVEITRDTHPVDIAKAIAEYGFLRMQDRAARPHVYLAQRIGTDSDHHASIKPSRLLLSADDQVLKAVDGRFHEVINLRDDIQRDEVRIKRITDPAAKTIVERSLADNRRKLEVLQPNESPAPDHGGAPMFSRSFMAGRTNRQYTPAQELAMKNVGFDPTPVPLKDKIKGLWANAGTALAQGLVDQFAPVKDMDKDAYGLLRLAKGAAGAFEAMLKGGQLKITGGVYDFDSSKRGGVLDKLLIPLQGEHHDFLRWVAANRAERLSGQGKENLFTPADIKALKSLADGVSNFDYTVQNGAQAGKVTRDRTLIYADALKTFNEFNTNVLDMAEQSGLIDGEARKLWENEFYVPFYRVEDDGTVAGADIKNGAVRQQAFKSLTGRTEKLNADLLDNTLMNWSHLLDASAKNRAAKASIEAAEKLGVASEIAGPEGKGTVWFRENGEKRFSMIHDPYLLTAITALEYAGMRSPVMKAMGAFKHALTTGVTASPFFKVRNLIRDSVQAIGTGPLSYNPAGNIAQGWKLTDPKSDAYFRLLAGGGTIHFGTMYEGSEARRVQSLVESGVDAASILDSPNKVKAFYRKFIAPGVKAYNELGNRGEAINRAALYDQLIKQGLSHADASLQARDLMDFSMQGSFASIRFLTQVVPFFNARIQGLYKLGRAAKEDPKRFSIVLGATALASIGLLLAFSGDEDWKKREDWDRNNFWWFKFGGTAFRIPKPFEIGAIATLAERGFELATDNEMTGKRFRSQVLALLGDNLSMNPIPQLVKPMLDVYANQDSFTGRPIETMGMEKLKSEYRFNQSSSMVARGASTALNAVTGLVDKEALSPLQIDHLLRGYFGWLGTFVIGAGDLLARPVTDQPDRPAPDYWRTATGGMVSDLRDAPSRYVSQMYAQAKEIEQAYATWRELVKEGKVDEASAFREEHQEELAKYHAVEGVKKAESALSRRQKMIELSQASSDEKREQLRQISEAKDSAARRLAVH